MTNKIQRRWGILSLAVLMFFIYFFSILMIGANAAFSFYASIWIWVGYFAYKEQLDKIQILMKYLIYLNIVLAIFIKIFEADDVVTNIIGIEKTGLWIGTFLMLLPKIFLFLYCESESENKELKKIAATPKEKLDSEIFYDEMEDNRVFTSIAVEKLDTSKNFDEEKFWENALNEYEGKDKRKGLYAKLYSESQGVESLIKSQYLKFRVSEMRESLLSGAGNIDYSTAENYFFAGKYQTEKIGNFSCIYFPNGECAIEITDGFRLYDNKKNLSYSINSYEYGGIFSKKGFIRLMKK